MTVIAALLLAGCVAVRENTLVSENRAIPPGQAVLYILAPRAWADIDSAGLELQIGEMDPVPLRMRALNRILVPEGAWTLHLTLLPQEPDNARTQFVFSAGETTRLLLLRRPADGAGSETPAGDSTENKDEYLLLPVKRSLLEEVVREEHLPVVDIVI